MVALQRQKTERTTVPQRSSPQHSFAGFLLLAVHSSLSWDYTFSKAISAFYWRSMTSTTFPIWTLQFQDHKHDLTDNIQTDSCSYALVPIILLYLTYYIGGLNSSYLWISTIQLKRWFSLNSTKYIIKWAIFRNTSIGLHSQKTISRDYNLIVIITWLSIQALSYVYSSFSFKPLPNCKGNLDPSNKIAAKTGEVLNKEKQGSKKWRPIANCLRTVQNTKS